MFQTDWLSVCVTHQPFNIMIQKTLLRGRGTSIIMKLNESNKKVKIRKKKHLRTIVRCQYELSVTNGQNKINTKTGQKMIIFNLMIF